MPGLPLDDLQLDTWQTSREMRAGNGVPVVAIVGMVHDAGERDRCGVDVVSRSCEARSKVRQILIRRIVAARMKETRPTFGDSHRADMVDAVGENSPVEVAAAHDSVGLAKLTRKLTKRSEPSSRANRWRKDLASKGTVALATVPSDNVARHHGDTELPP